MLLGFGYDVILWSVSPVKLGKTWNLNKTMSGLNEYSPRNMQIMSTGISLVAIFHLYLVICWLSAFHRPKHYDDQCFRITSMLLLTI